MDSRPPGAASPHPSTLRDHYRQQYGVFAEDVYVAVRREIFDEDFGQNSWHTAEEHTRFVTWLDLDPTSRVLDVACGAGGPAMRLARLAGCHVLGIDFHAEGVAAARAAAERAGLADRVAFEVHDASQVLPFPAAAFEGVLCVDAINHLPHRPAVLREWWRVLKPGGRLVFTDPIVVTGPLSNDEIATRAAIGLFHFVPPGYDERLLADAGFEVAIREDATAEVANVAGRWHDVRAHREAALREAEGDMRYAAQQAFFAMCARPAREERLSRFAYLARKPVEAG